MSAELVPFDVARHWERHHKYFATRGVDPWNQGEIPSLSTNNYAFARQVAALVAARVDDLVAAGRLGADQPVDLLEVGSGIGTFAANFLRALDEGLGEAGRALAARVRYCLSDYSETTVRQAAAGPELSAAAAAGRLLPACYDLRAPDKLRRLDGAEAPRFVALIANYVCCVLPAKHLQKRGAQWWQLSLRDSDPVDGIPSEPGWAPVILEQAFPDPLYARVAAAATDGMDEATVSVPYGFFDFLRGARPLLHEGGVAVVNDYGNVLADQLRGLREVRPRFYGDSVNQEVCFAVFDAFAAADGQVVARTENPLRTIHTAVVAAEPLGERTRAVFEDLFVARHAGQELLDRVAAARVFAEREEHVRAIRFFQRALDLDGGNAEMYLRIGSACVSLGLTRFAVSALERGRALDVWARWDFDFELGRALTGAREYPAAIARYRASLERAEHPTTYTNLGSLLAESGDFPGALQAFKRAHALDPKHERANERLAALKEAWWAKIAGGD